VFGCTTLDDRNWVQDFGGLKDIKAWLKEKFDHTLCIAEDDPELQTILLLDGRIADVRVLPAVGCEKFAEYVFNHVSKIIDQDSSGRVWLDSVEVREHGANSAVYQRDRNST
jgi:6-pyruvoyltetrahydropterin/6-carboxytetrahydropterin synthase